MLKFHFNLPQRVIPAENTGRRSTDRGEIYLETEYGFFPSIGWSDLMLSVIIQWIDNAIKMVDPKYGEQNTTNYFMNGPYSFDIQKTEKNHIIMRFIKNTYASEKIEEIPSINITFTDYYNAFLGPIENLINDSDFQWFGKEQERINLKQRFIILKAWL